MLLLSLAAFFTCTQSTVQRSTCSYLNGIYASVMRRIYNQGFHKELSTEVELMLTTLTLPDRCSLVVEETVPKGMYVDPNQLRDISEFTGLRTFVGGELLLY